MTLKLPNFAGSGGGGGGGGDIAPNNIFSNATLCVLDLLSEGQIGGLVDGAKSIFLDNVPLQNESGTYNYEGVSVDWVNGTADQKVLDGFGDVSTPQTVGSEVKQGYPIVVAIENNEADVIRVVVNLPSLYASNDEGDIYGTSVKFRFELAINNTGNYQHLGDFTIEGKQNSQYQRAYEFDLPQDDGYGEKPAQWLFKMTRLSEDSSERYSARTILDTIFVINKSKLNYPYSAIVGLKVDSEKLSQVPTRSYLIDGLIIQIPSNYDPKTNRYSGVWDGTFKMAVSDNPAWILYALLTNERWGLGEFIKPNQINKARLYEIGRYCDEEIDDGYGKKEKRFAINTQIQERSDAYRLISDICAVFRGMAFWAGGMTNFMCDMPTEASMLYTPANVIDGMFTYSGSSRNDRHSVALVSWNDPEQNYKKVVEYIEDGDLIRKYGIRQAEMTAFGCTSRAQAIRTGRWILYTESNESDMIQFNVGLDSALVLPGDVIKIQDPSYAGKRNGGRLHSVTQTSAELDADVDLTTGVGATISFRMSDGSVIERELIVSYSGPRRKVEWNNPLTELPQKNAIWLISEESLSPIIARVVNVQQGDEKNTFTITAVSHEPRKFDLIEKGIDFTRDQTTTNPLDVSAPVNPNVEENATALGLGYISSTLVVTWLAGRNCVSYELRWRRENENETDWETVTTTSKSISLPDVQRGMYHFMLYGVGLMGNRSEVVEFYYLASGQYVTPLDVTDFKVIKRPSYLEVTWEPVEDAFAYEVRCGNSWDDSEVLIASFAGTSFTHYQYEAGTYYYHIRSISASGEYSPNTTTFKLELNAPATPTDLVAVVSQGRIDFKWKANTEDDLSHYEMREGQNWESGVKVAESKVSQMTVPGGAQQTRRFWLKAIALPKIYSDDAAWVEIGVPEDETRNLVISHNARQFQWTSNMVYMEKSGDDIRMIDGETRGEYIYQMVLPDKLTAQNSFYTSVYTAVQSSEDTETWLTATYPWNDPKAERSWRLSGDAATIGYENQIARHVGLINEISGWSLEETLVGEDLSEPSKTVGVSYDWGRYTKGLKLSDTTGVTWETPIVGNGDENGFKMSFWIKTATYEEGQTYILFKMGNDNHELEVSYNSSDKTCRLTDDLGNTLDIECELAANRHIFFAISQSANQRAFGVGVLGWSTNLKTGEYEPIGPISWMKVGTEAV